MPPWKKIIKEIKDNQSFLIASHINPDGDAVGSMAGLGFILNEMGKKIELYNASGLPREFSWLPLPQVIKQKANPDKFDWVIVLDCGDGYRLGDDLEERLDYQRVINIDHHISNPKFGGLNWVEPDRSSVGEMIAYLAKEMKLSVSGDLGQSLYLAIVSDTGCFTYSNTKPSTLEIVLDILKSGLDLDDFNSKYMRQWTLNKLHLHGAAMQKARLYANNKIGVISADQNLLDQTGTTIEDCEGLINQVRKVKDVLVAISLREEGFQTVKFSLRSWGQVDVRAIASSLGGGGHRNASGGTLYSSLPEAEHNVVQEVKKRL